MAPTQKNGGDTTGHAPAPSPTTDTIDGQTAHNKGGAGDASPIYDNTRRQLLIFVQDLARELNDTASLRSSTSRLANLYHKSGLSMEDFIEHLYAARAVTQERSASIRGQGGDGAEGWKKNKMSYFFAVLEGQLGLREQIVGD